MEDYYSKQMKNGGLLFDLNPSELTEKEMIDLGFIKYSNENDIYLIPLWSLPFLKNGIKVEFIDGEVRLLDKSTVDTDNRFGCVAFGVSPKSI